MAAWINAFAMRMEKNANFELFAVEKTRHNFLINNVKEKDELKRRIMDQKSGEHCSYLTKWKTSRKFCQGEGAEL